MINKIKNSYYQYNPNEFMPIYVDNVWANRAEFHTMKLKHVGERVAQIAHNLATSTPYDYQ